MKLKLSAYLERKPRTFQHSSLILSSHLVLPSCQCRTKRIKKYAPLKFVMKLIDHFVCLFFLLLGIELYRREKAQGPHSTDRKLTI